MKRSNMRCDDPTSPIFTMMMCRTSFSRRPAPVRRERRATGRTRKAPRRQGCALLGVGWGVAGLPLDTAADTGMLIAVDRLPSKYGIDRGTKIDTGHRLVVAGATAVQLSSVDQPLVVIKEIEVRGAGCLVGLCDFLRVVKAERKTKVEVLGHLLEPFRGILRIVHRIVAADADEAKLSVRIVLSNPGNLHLDMHHIGAMPAEKDDQQAGLSGKRVE